MAGNREKRFWPVLWSLAPFSAASRLQSGQVVGQPAGPPPTPRHTGTTAMVKGLVTDVKNLPSRENLFWVGVGAGLSLAVHPADDSVNQHLVGKGLADTGFTPGRIIGGRPAPFCCAGAHPSCRRVRRRHSCPAHRCGAPA